MDSSDSYDGIIIGAGQHGLILGGYLARQGLRILLVERRLQYGGGLSTEERTLPGFYHNLHSVNHFSITSTPWFNDLGLSARVRYVTPRYEFAQPHADGTALVFSRDLEETLASIARFDKRDAETFREWNAKAEEMTQRIFLRERYSEPLGAAERDEILGRSAIGREFLALTRRQPGEVVEELFHDERVKVLFLFKLSLFGTVLHEALGTHSPLGSLIRAFDLTTGYELCEGGSWNLARGLMEAFVAAGGHFVNQAHVNRIVVEGGRATGVELADGRHLRARQFVASTLDVHQTFEDMIGRDQLPAAFLDRLDGFRYTGWTLFGVHLALREAPDYAAAKFDPNLNKALKYNVGSETIQSLMDAHDDVEQGRVPRRVQFGAGALSVLDPKQAPPGRHTAYAWHVVPWAPDGDHENLKAIQESTTRAIIEKWREYAPNLTDDNILGTYTYTAHEYSQHLINMRHGDIFMGALSGDQVLHNHFGYRTPLPNLYLAGSATHPNGAISGGAGYICAGLIARDLGLDPWWQPLDARVELARLTDG
ncbi:phytoene desaturase family protein [Phytohabitans kaempferiae]|uniref:Pyridine nucleotide-disulfide oxidoreductase domain-containing protein 2 n=1 Tax=Phytohabitans kaempferiae TaxID=1620943 RepID=A0ABV6LZL4_9ACTN